MAEHVFVLCIACAENHDLHRVLTQFFHDIGYQIKSFLIRQSGTHADHHSLGIYFQSQFLLQRRFILDFFLPEILGIIPFENVRIRLGIIFVVVNTVDNTAQTIASCPHQPVQALPVKWSLYLFRIRITHCRNGVRINNTALQIIGVPVGLQFIRRKIVI